MLQKGSGKVKEEHLCVTSGLQDQLQTLQLGPLGAMEPGLSPDTLQHFKIVIFIASTSFVNPGIGNHPKILTGFEVHALWKLFQQVDLTKPGERLDLFDGMVWDVVLLGCELFFKARLNQRNLQVFSQFYC